MALPSDSDWGTGVFQTNSDLEVVKTWDNMLGLRELRAKINGRAGIAVRLPPNNFSIHAENCFHERSAEIMRKYLDSGVLRDHLNKDLLHPNRVWTAEDFYAFLILTASIMTLGCTIPKEMRACLKAMFPPAKFKKAMADPDPDLKGATVMQVAKAFFEYKDGEPYDFGNLTELEDRWTRHFGGTLVDKTKDVGVAKVMKIELPPGSAAPFATPMVFAPTDKGIDLKPLYPNHLCADCGAAETADGEELVVCSKCKDRKYCGQDCQKAHWPMHKLICQKPGGTVDQFIDSIMPLDLGDIAFLDGVGDVRTAVKEYQSRTDHGIRSWVEKSKHPDGNGFELPDDLLRRLHKMYL